MYLSMSCTGRLLQIEYLSGKYNFDMEHIDNTTTLHVLMYLLMAMQTLEGAIHEARMMSCI